MNTLNRSTTGRRSGSGTPPAALPPEHLQALLRLASGLLDAEGDAGIMAALGRYLTSELNVAEGLFLLCGEPDFACVFTSDGQVHAAADGHALMASARASLRGVHGRSAGNIGVAQQPHDGVPAALVVRWKRQGIQRPLSDQDTLLSQASELAVKAMSKLRRSQPAVPVETLTDPLTGLTSRSGFILSAEHAFLMARRRHAVSAVIFADVANLDAVSEAWGQETGDALIRDASNIFRQSFRRADIVGRLGDEEFAAFTLDDEDPGTVLRRIEQNTATFNSGAERPYQVLLNTALVACDPAADYGLAHYLQQQRCH